MEEGKAMKTVIHDEMLGRLVSYEKYVKHCFTQLSRRRRLEVSADVMCEYEELKKFTIYISTLVDLAFNRYGIENGLMKGSLSGQDLALNKDLETLVAQLFQISPETCSPLRERTFALAV